MTSKLNRLFSSLIEIPKSKYGLGFAQSNTSIISTSTRREFVCSAGQQQQQERPKNSAEEDISAPLSETNEKIENLSENEIEDEDEDDGELVNSDGERVNRETGEIGGPKGPEPTRYGDWERGGRCSDF